MVEYIYNYYSTRALFQATIWFLVFCYSILLFFVLLRFRYPILFTYKNQIKIILILLSATFLSISYLARILLISSGNFITGTKSRHYISNLTGCCIFSIWLTIYYLILVLYYNSNDDLTIDSKIHRVEITRYILGSLSSFMTALITLLYGVNNDKIDFVIMYLFLGFILLITTTSLIHIIRLLRILKHSMPENTFRDFKGNVLFFLCIFYILGASEYAFGEGFSRISDFNSR